MTSAQVLFIDDEDAIRMAVQQWLGLADLAVTCFARPDAALAQLSPDFAGVVVTDIRMPGMDGMAVLGRALAVDGDIPVLLVTGHGDVPMAVAAMRQGAYDFLEKPFDPERLVESVRRALDHRRLVLENRALRRRLNDADCIEARLIGTSAAMEDVRRQIADLAGTDASVIIHGETGTGKEVVARCLHDLGHRARAPFVAINCGAIPESMFESEIFGHEAGAFTGAVQKRVGKLEFAKGGTVFLDEIESMPMAAQVKVLRALQERRVERLGSNQSIELDFRVVAATKTDLLDAAARGTFRQDLYYRLNIAELYLPPLRDRREDIALLFETFATQAAAVHGRPLRPLGPADVAELQTHSWPGNVRELKNVAERFALGGGGVSGLLARKPQGAAPARTLADAMEAFERQMIEQALDKARGDIAAAMEMLDLPRRTLNEKMARHGLNRSRYL